MTIAEVAKKFEMSADTLRYYERIGLIPPVRRNSGGIRDYSEQDTNWVNFIKCMRGAGLSIESLAEYVALFAQGSSTTSARKDILIEQRTRLASRIEEMQKVLKHLDTKIDGYEDLLLKYEEKLKNKE